MRIGFETNLCCPKCRANVLLNSGYTTRDSRVFEGSLVCSEHGVIFRIVESIVVEELQLDEALQAVSNFWTSHVCGGEWNEERKQFEDLRKYRYETHPWLSEVAEFDKHKQDRVMEIGCSQGIDMVEFLNMGVKEYIGVDLSFKSLLLARRRLEHFGLYHLPVTLLCSNAENLPFAPAIVDYVYSYGVIHHSADTLRAIKSIESTLRPGGKLTAMYYYKYSLTALIEGFTRLLNRALMVLTGNQNTFWKLCRKLPYKPAIGPYRKFLDTGYSAILHAPFAHTFSKSESHIMFAAFRIESLKLYNLSPIVRPFLGKVFGRKTVAYLASWIGWDLVIKGNKI